MNYDVIVIGAGPAGLFAAYEITRKSDLKVCIVEMGKDVKNRTCPMEITDVCTKCKPCNIMCGIGGAGGLSDGTLNLRPDIGGNLEEFISKKEAWQLIKDVDKIYLDHGTPDKLYEASKVEEKELSRLAASSGTQFIQIPQRHIGSDFTPQVIESISKNLLDNGVKFMMKTSVKDILDSKIKLSNNKTMDTKYILATPGRSGAPWLVEQANKLGLRIRHGAIDVGVRVEVPSIVMEPVCTINRDPKFHIITPTYDDLIRTFCVNHQGFVVKEVYEDYIGVNGHSLRDEHSINTNFAFLTKIELTEPMENSTIYGETIAKTATTLGGGNPLIQRLGDLRRGRRSTWNRINRGHITPTMKNVTPGDVSMVMPHRIVTNILEGLDKLDKTIPGVASDSTLLYAPEIKFYAMRVEVGKSMETSIPNLFVAGDGAGVSRGLIVASATGILAAKGILAKEGIKSV
jgi:uncharacterized FAD-dependent dehydrogenase|tara:strand:- start:4692 stop:6068 length:1377 start_codon:yes stop_codon:yes gene_type:complete